MSLFKMIIYWKNYHCIKCMLTAGWVIIPLMYILNGPDSTQIDNVLINQSTSTSKFLTSNVDILLLNINTWPLSGRLKIIRGLKLGQTSVFFWQEHILYLQETLWTHIHIICQWHVQLTPELLSLPIIQIKAHFHNWEHAYIHVNTPTCFQMLKKNGTS